MIATRLRFHILRTLPVLAVLCGLVIGTGSAFAGVRIYVDKNGVGGAPNDSRDRTTASSPSTPVATIERGMTLALAGDTVLVRAATFVRSSPLGLGKGGIVLKAYPGELVKLDFSGASTGNGINFGADGITLEGFEITNAPEEGVSTWFTSNNTIRKNHIHHCGLVLVNNKYQNGIAAYGSNILIEQNLVHDTGSHNMYIYGDRITVRNNVSYATIAPADRGSYGIQIGTPGANCTNITIAHNVFAESKNRSSIVFYSPNATISNVVIVNNVLVKNPYSPVYVYSDVGTTFSNIQIKNNIFSENGRGNCVFFTNTNSCSTPPSTFSVSGNLTFASQSLIGFRNLGAHDYFPVVGSSMIDRGLAGYATNDFTGTPRPQGTSVDIGPFEAISGGGVDVIRPAAIGDLN
ncbi:MAG TPA: right-handed parallel beta-helix repeat-containing protein [Candidatus Eisenbacteria bacterium]|nr:right-handed parallel beta-helix repeat-containing protein [Candidatus Eisenbacteria bacterium]